LADAQLPIILRQVLLCEKQWKVLQNTPGLILMSSMAPIPDFFWRYSEATKISYNNQRDDADEDVLQALAPLGERSKPIDLVEIRNIKLSTCSFVSKQTFLRALGGVKRMHVGCFHVCPSTWKRFWLSPLLQKNDALVDLHLAYIPSMTALTRAGDWRPLEVIRDCLQTNWFLREILLPTSYLSESAECAYWQANIEPYLVLNRRDLPRLAPGEQRLSVLHDAIVKVRNHPNKLRNLLLKFPQACSPMRMQDRLSDLEQSKSDLRAAKTFQDAQIVELQCQVREQQRRMNILESQLQSLSRRKREL
jgi:hypothetical protein